MKRNKKNKFLAKVHTTDVLFSIFGAVLVGLNYGWQIGLASWFFVQSLRQVNTLSDK